MPDCHRQGWLGNPPVHSRPRCVNPTTRVPAAIGTTGNVALGPLNNTPLGCVIIFSIWGTAGTSEP